MTRADPHTFGALALALALSALALPSCYLAHERPAAAADCASAPSYPATPPGEDADALAVVGDPLPLPDEVRAMWPPTLVAGDPGFGVSWLTSFRVLDADGAPSASGPSVVGGRFGLAFGGDRFALTSPGHHGSHLFFFDPLANPIEPRGEYDSAVWSFLAWRERAREWIVASSVEAGGLAGMADAMRIRVETVTEDGASHRVAHEIVTSDTVTGMRVAATADYVLVVWVAARRVSGLVLGGEPLAPVGDPFLVLDHAVGTGEGEPNVAAYGGRFVVTSNDGRHARAALVDPCAPNVSSTFVVGPTVSVAYADGVASAPDRGFFVVCHPVGAGTDGPHGGPPDGVRLQAMGEDGRRWGRALTLATAVDYVGGVDCGWNGREVVVVWRDGPRIFSQRVRTTFL